MTYSAPLVLAEIAVPVFLGVLVVLLAGAKLGGVLAQCIGQPAVLGELVAGVLLGPSLIGLVNPQAKELQARELTEILHLFGDLGVVILLFLIGLETDLSKLLRVGGAAAAVAGVGVVLPFVLGFGVCRLLGLTTEAGVVAGASLTATSVGITARVLTDLHRLQEPESQIILGAAVIDDVVGLVILTVVVGLTKGETLTGLGVAWIAALAFGFLAVTLVVGRFVVPPVVRLVSRVTLPGTPTMLALVAAFGLAYLAWLSGSATIIGAFAAGLLLRETPQAREMEHGVAQLGHFFVPLFFVTVGAEVNLQSLANSSTLQLGGLLIGAAVLGKLACGYAPYWFKGNKLVIGVGMVPRGEVGLIFAQAGRDAKVFDEGMFSAVALMVMVTTFMAPPLLKLLFPLRTPEQPTVKPEGIEDLTTEA